MMYNYKAYCLTPDKAMRDAANLLDRSGLKVALVVEHDMTLMGIVTDGDIRRAILKGSGLDTPVSEIMTRNPRLATADTERSLLIDRLRHEQILHLPIVDDAMRVVDLAYLPELEKLPNYHNTVVIMAGGLGKRLLPITKNIPKPMVEVGGQPLIRTNIDMLISQGFVNITISLNHLGEIIEDYLGDGAQFGAMITYVRETKRLGTGGALTLIDKPTEPFVVMNGDILTSVDLSAMLAFHTDGNAHATMAVNKHRYSVPFGVVQLKDNSRIAKLREKPDYDLFVNAGIYVLSPDVLDLVPLDTYFDMPSLFEILIERGDETLAFPIREHWHDVGQPDDLEKANESFAAVVGAHGFRTEGKNI